MRRMFEGCGGGRDSVGAVVYSEAINDNGASEVATAGATGAGAKSDMFDRLTSAAKLVTALHVASRKGPGYWRKVSAIGKSAGIEDPMRLERAVQDATIAGLVQRRASQGLVKLTAEGRGLGA